MIFWKTPIDDIPTQIKQLLNKIKFIDGFIRSPWYYKINNENKWIDVPSAKKIPTNAAASATKSSIAHPNIRKSTGTWITNSAAKEKIGVWRVIKAIRRSLKYMLRVNSGHRNTRPDPLNNRPKCLLKPSKIDSRLEARSSTTTTTLNRAAPRPSSKKICWNNATNW